MNWLTVCNFVLLGYYIYLAYKYTKTLQETDKRIIEAKEEIIKNYLETKELLISEFSEKEKEE